MPFRIRQKMPSYSVGKISYLYPQVDSETSVSRMVDTPQQFNLPDSKMTDLALQLKAGVNLQQVDCNLIDPDVSSLSKVFNAPEKQQKDGE